MYLCLACVFDLIHFTDSGSFAEVGRQYRQISANTFFFNRLHHPRHVFASSMFSAHFQYAIQHLLFSMWLIREASVGAAVFNGDTVASMRFLTMATVGL